MALEIEAKFRVDSHDALRERLRALDAERVARMFERNHIFDRADRSLLVRDEGLRVRAFERVEGVAPPPTLTYKGRRMGGAFKTREEHETTVGDAAAACAILAALGFVEVILFEKRRERWRLGACAVELDELPYLGRYVEIEGPDADAVRRVQQLLELDAQPSIRSSYIALLLEHCRETGRPSRQITFEARPEPGHG